MLYTSKDNEKIKNVRKLNNKKYRDQQDLFLVEGEHLVLEAYKKGYIKELFIEENTVLPLNVPTNYVTNDLLSFMSDLVTPYPVMAVCNKLKPAENIGNKILILDNIQDPGNLGTIIRSAVAFNIDTIVLSMDTVDLYNPKVIRATQGLIFHINIIRKDIKEFIPFLKNNQYHIYGTRVTHGKSLKDVEKKERFAIIMGNEGNGIKEETKDLCDEYIYIPMNPNCESLNVAIATSLILYELDK